MPAPKNNKLLRKPGKRLLALLSDAKPEDERLIRTLSNMFIKDTPRGVHALFKSKCAARGRTMRGAFLAFMVDVTKYEGKPVIDFGRLLTTYPDPK